jgi:hypothetical protein
LRFRIALVERGQRRGFAAFDPVAVDQKFDPAAGNVSWFIANFRRIWLLLPVR